MKQGTQTRQSATLLLACLLASLLLGCGGSQDSSSLSPRSSTAVAASPRPVVLVFAAASLTNAMAEINRDFAAGHDIDVQTSYAASSTLAQQIVHGAEADVFISADTNWIDFVSKQGLVERRDDLLGNRLVIVVPADAKTTFDKPEGLLEESIRHVAIGEPQSVPAGKYARRALEELGLWEKLHARFVSADDVRHALAYVETGAAEAGIVYATDAAISTKVRVAYEFPASLTGPIVYPAALLKHGADRPAATDFSTYLRGAQAKAIFTKYGFTVLPASEATTPSAATSSDTSSSHPSAARP